MGKKNDLFAISCPAMSCRGGRLREVKQPPDRCEVQDRIRRAYRETRRRRNALAMTETELKLIAALASMGLSNQPKMG